MVCVYPSISPTKPSDSIAEREYIVFVTKTLSRTNKNLVTTRFYMKQCTASGWMSSRQNNDPVTQWEKRLQIKQRKREAYQKVVHEIRQHQSSPE